MFFFRSTLCFLVLGGSFSSQRTLPNAHAHTHTMADIVEEIIDAPVATQSEWFGRGLARGGARVPHEASV